MWGGHSNIHRIRSTQSKTLHFQRRMHQCTEFCMPAHAYSVCVRAKPLVTIATLLSGRSTKHVRIVWTSHNIMLHTIFSNTCGHIRWHGHMCGGENACDELEQREVEWQWGRGYGGHRFDKRKWTNMSHECQWYLFPFFILYINCFYCISFFFLTSHPNFPKCYKSAKSQCSIDL